MTKRFFHEKPALALVLLGVLVMLIALYAIHHYSREHLHLARQTLIQEALAHFENIVVTRHWNAMYGGVYVKPHGDLQPNPFLKDGVLECAHGEQLIKINPAWMTRQISELTGNNKGYYYHITSLKPLNPANRPDDFEQRALEYFERSSSKTYYYEFNDSETFNFVGALSTEKPCLQCHAHQGYDECDIRGGIRVSLPMELYREQVALIDSRQWILSIAVMVMGGIGIYLFIRLLLLVRQRELEMVGDNQTLARKVAENTREVTNLFIREKYLRGILQTVADINQLIITAQAEDDLLRHVCIRLCGHHPYLCADIYVANPDTAASAPFSLGDEGIQPAHQPSESPRAGREGAEDLRPETFMHYQCGRDSHVKTVNRASLPEAASQQNWHTHIEQGKRNIYLPLLCHTQNLGVLGVTSSRKEGFETEEIAMLRELSNDLAFAVHALRQRFQVKNLETERAANYEDTILSFVHMIEQRDTYTAGHTIRVADYSVWIAQAMGCDTNTCKRLHKAAILHDIGKIATPDSILLKPEHLSKLEYTLIQEHAITGYEMLSKIRMYQDLALIVRHHHEHHDGSGYPDQLCGDAIPLLARIIAVADAFDAMTTNRIYKARKSVAEALTEVAALSGQQFHPEVVKAALPMLARRAKPPETTQMPHNEVEQVRFAYFFYDPLTGLLNERYLKILLNNKELPEFCHIFNLSGFAQYNHIFGWARGDTVLKALARVLTTAYPDHFVFRIRGDYFILFSATQISIDVNDIKQGAEFPAYAALGLQYRSQNTYDSMGALTIL